MLFDPLSLYFTVSGSGCFSCGAGFGLGVGIVLKPVIDLLALNSETALIDVNSVMAVNPVATLVILIIFSWVNAIQLNK